MKTILKTLCVAAIMVSAAGCESPPATSQDNAVQAQREAEQERVIAARTAAEKIATAQAEAAATANKARDEAQRATEEGQDNAVKAATEATRDLTIARNDLRERAEASLKDVDRDIARARTDAQTKTPQVKTRFEEVMRDVETQRAAVQQELTTLETRTADGWDRFETSFEARVDALEERMKDARARLWCRRRKLSYAVTGGPAGGVFLMTRTSKTPPDGLRFPVSNGDSRTFLNDQQTSHQQRRYGHDEST